MIEKKHLKTVKKNATFRLIDSIILFLYNLITNYFVLQFLGADEAGLYAAITSVSMIFFSWCSGILIYYSQKIYRPVAEKDYKQVSKYFWSKPSKNWFHLLLIKSGIL